jgi:cell division protein FtsL
MCCPRNATKSGAELIHSLYNVRRLTNQAPKYIMQRVKLEQSWRDTQAKD